MFSSIEIIGFLVLLYTGYLILTEGSNKNENDGENSDNKKADDATKDKQNDKPRVKKSAPVQTIEDDPDVLKQGKGYTEQSSSEQPNVTPRSQQHFKEPQAEQQTVNTEAPSSKNREPEQPAIETVSVICPYCDNKVLVPKGGSAECSCCSSRLNDMGTVID